MIKPMFAGCAALLLVACASQAFPTGPAGEPQSLPSGSCAVASSSDWQAWVNAVPGPDARPKLIVTGKVVTPTGGNRVELGPDLEIRESYPVQIVATVRVVRLGDVATQAFQTHDVRGEWPMAEKVGSVTIRCGDRTLALISAVGTAY